MPKRVFTGSEARERILAGARQIYEPVRSTMGPLGRNVIIGNQFGLPVPTHDGVTVAKSIDLPKSDDTLGHAEGAQLMQLAASKVNDQVGDGTTTVTVLAYHLLNEAHKLIAAGHNPMLLKRQLDTAAAKVMDLLPAYVEKISGNQDKLRQVATISAGGDEFLGHLIAEVMGAVGEDGSVTVEQSQGSTVTFEMVDGFQFDRGLVTPYMVTDPTHMRAVVEKTPILITDARISSINDILPVMERLAQSGTKKLVIICDDLDGDALQTLVMNTRKGSFQTIAIKAPAFGDRRKETLQDIATLTGGYVVSADQGMELSQTTLDMLGTARSVIADRENTIIVEGDGDKEAVAERIATIRTQAAAADSEFNKEKLEERAAALAGKVAVIKVGGLSETEIEEKKFRVDDAVAATKAALAEGIVAGGGATLLNMVDQFAAGKRVTGDPGETLLLNTLEQPFLQLMDNSGHEAGFLRAKVREAAGRKELGYGFSVYDPTELVDLKAAGIIDPAKVTREAIQNAVSIAGTAMTMGSLVVDIPADPR